LRYRVLIAAVCAAALLVPAAPATAKSGVVAKLKAPGHHPKAGKPWPIKVTVRSKGGKGLRATALYHFIYNGQVVGVTSVYGRHSKKPYPFKGSYRDKLKFPKRAVGLPQPLTFQVVLKIKHHGTKHLNYKIRVRR
jgi:hypothetical protein